MQVHDVRLDVTDSAALATPLELAATIYLPTFQTLSAPPILMCAIPGGGYSRHYFDMRFTGREGYSQAEHHVARGIIFAAFDLIGSGDSAISDQSLATFPLLAATYTNAVRQIADRLERGDLAPRFPAVANAVRIGIGQSLGGCVTLHAQGRESPFDAIAVLGFSATHTVLPQRNQVQSESAMKRFETLKPADAEGSARTDYSGLDFAYAFHWDDVPKEIVEADITEGFPARRVAAPFASLTRPGCSAEAMRPGQVAAQAAAIVAPLFLGFGERDTSPNPYAEPSAYTKCRDITLMIVPTMAHMHNFASTRAVLWDRLVDWSTMVARNRARRRT